MRYIHKITGQTFKDIKREYKNIATYYLEEPYYMGTVKVEVAICLKSNVFQNTLF